jgi:hypothetical protein
MKSYERRLGLSLFFSARRLHHITKITTATAKITATIPPITTPMVWPMVNCCWATTPVAQSGVVVFAEACKDVLVVARVVEGSVLAATFDVIKSDNAVVLDTSVVGSAWTVVVVTPLFEVGVA